MSVISYTDIHHQRDKLCIYGVKACISIHKYKDKFSLYGLVFTGGNFSNYEFNDWLKSVIYLTNNVPGLVNSGVRGATLSEEFQCCSWSGGHQFLLGVPASFWMVCHRRMGYFGMFHAFAVMRSIEYLHGFLWINQGNLFKRDFGVLGFLSLFQCP